MDKLREIHNRYINKTSTKFIRSYTTLIPWNERLVGIRGARGVGKTTLILQYIKNKYKLSEKAIYISLDDFYFTQNNLIDFVDDFVKSGGVHIFIDEVHKYPNWVIQIKNIYDYHDSLKIVFTGSSLLDILDSRVDLSRRALVYEMQGLSFREFLALNHNYTFDAIKLDQLISNHVDITAKIVSVIKPLRYFKEYLRFGYYPFYQKDIEIYYLRLREIINMIIEIELPLLRKVDVSKVNKIRQLLYIIAQSVPFKPNISSLSSKTGITRNTLVEYIKSLEDANLIQNLNKNTFGISLLQKPDKIYLENSNLAYALTGDNTNIGNIRETFFFNQVKNKHHVTYPIVGDFLVDSKYLFEIGGKTKSNKQILNIENSFVVRDDIEFGSKNKLPLWLFGFLY